MGRCLHGDVVVGRNEKERKGKKMKGKDTDALLRCPFWLMMPI